ncbi:SDR family NAD(P)-dependent oxidoreductase [Neobacillus niacini]|uniref:SDR family NAD(P)-dependent oxidoreductase n=1 Tax=Neobacillus niacini TaxID=86668 RepID=UPI002FFD8387
MNLAGRVAIVTGAGRGLGRAISLALAAEGAKVIVVDPGVTRDGSNAGEKPADEVVNEIRAAGGNAKADYTSVTDFHATEQLIKNTVEEFGSLDILVNCAGILRERMIWNMTEEEWDGVIAVHQKGTFNMTRHAAKVMREQKFGRIINIASDAWRGTVGQSNYGAAKGAIVSFTRSVARELGRSGVTVNAICPIAATRMNMHEGAIAGFKKRLEAGLITKEYYDQLMAMPGPEYVPPIIVYLATEQAKDINGQVFHAEKGRVSIYSEPVEVRAIYKKVEDGLFTLDELIDAVPNTLLVGYKNPAPSEN